MHMGLTCPELTCTLVNPCARPCLCPASSRHVASPFVLMVATYFAFTDLCCGNALASSTQPHTLAELFNGMPLSTHILCCLATLPAYLQGLRLRLSQLCVEPADGIWPVCPCCVCCCTCSWRAFTAYDAEEGFTGEVLKNKGLPADTHLEVKRVSCTSKLLDTWWLRDSWFVLLVCVCVCGGSQGLDQSTLGQSCV